MSLFKVKEFQPAEILLKKGQLAKEIFIVLLGEI